MDKKPKILPNDLEAEQSLLGCLFLSVEACTDVFVSLVAKLQRVLKPLKMCKY